MVKNRYDVAPNMSLMDDEEGEEFVDLGIVRKESDDSPPTSCETAIIAIGFKRPILKKSRSVMDHFLAKTKCCRTVRRQWTLKHA